MDKKLSLKEIYSAYKTWVAHNPTRCTDMELTLTWSSYFIASKLENSPIASELIYCFSRLLNMFNDSIIREAYNSEPQQNDLRHKIKVWLSISHYCEVTVELLTKKKYGMRGKWSAILVLQVTKCIATLFLLYKYKELPVLHPPIKFLRRKDLIEKIDENSNNCFTLRRTGRLIRRVEGAPPLATRNWQPVKVNTETLSPNVKDLYYAETIYALKPLLHLASVRVFGMNSWQQWLFSLGLDLSSLRVFEKHLKMLSNEQRIEVNSRKLSLLLYLIRSPMYHKYSGHIIETVLEKAANKLPLASYVCNPILRYISHLQEVYFYLWST